MSGNGSPGRDGDQSCAVSRADVSALIGVCAVLEGYLMADPERCADLRRHLGRRLAVDTAAPVDPDGHAVPRAVNDLNLRLRYALGERPDRSAPPGGSLTDPG